MATNRNFILRSVYLTPEMDDVLRNEAFDNHRSKNELIRHYIEVGMREEGALSSAMDALSEKSAQRLLMKP